MPGKPGPALPSEFAENLLHFRETDKHRYNGYVWLLRQAGWTCQSIADVVGVTRSAVHQRRNWHRITYDLPAVTPPPKS